MGGARYEIRTRNTHFVAEQHVSSDEFFASDSSLKRPDEDEIFTPFFKVGVDHFASEHKANMARKYQIYAVSTAQNSNSNRPNLLNSKDNSEVSV